MNEPLTFPPLMSGEPAHTDALEQACLRAAMGCDAGLIVYRLDPAEMQAALVFAPEIPLRQAMTMLPLCGVGLQNALGALAPPEASVHLGWDGEIRVNGASCGHFSAIASDTDPDAVPDWLVIGFTLPLLPPSQDTGYTPDQTALFAEGCADVSPPTLVEAWSRHTLNWLTRWEQDGSRALHDEWRGLAHGIGEDVTQNGQSGTFMGVDEDFGMLLRDALGKTQLLPLTQILKDPT